MISRHFARFAGLGVVLACTASGCRGGSGSGSSAGQTVVASVPESGVVGAAQRLGDSHGTPVYRTEYLSPVFLIDRIFKSMQGPAVSKPAVLLDSPNPELIWITAFRAIMMEPDGVTPAQPEFMCHVNMDVDGPAYHQAFPTKMPPVSDRLFSLDQGTLHVSLPEGFGIPTRSDLPLMLNTQVLNHNIVGKKFQVRMRLQIDFIRDRDLKQPLVPLTQRGVFGMVLLGGPDGKFEVDPASSHSAAQGASCSLGSDMGDPQGHIADAQGRKFSSFWRVAPGRHVYHTRVTPLLKLAYDTRVHFMSAHLHPFAESIKLVDMTTGQTMHELTASQLKGRVGLESVQTWSSAEGFPLYAKHEYDLVSVYDNTTDQQQDAMASLFMYVHARDLDVRALAARTPD
jgi:hypothetical protein